MIADPPADPAGPGAGLHPPALLPGTYALHTART
jgi:hypothetical protein